MILRKGLRGRGGREEGGGEQRAYAAHANREAFEQAQEVGLDLVEISPGADPPVAKFLDIGRNL
mgnify:CR=1 FL=1